ncbi:MAG: hypothetical protein WD960_00890 [Gemmatimonadota bacterium]
MATPDSAPILPGEERRWRQAIILASLYSLIVATGMWHHEMWRDEWQAWMLARDVSSLAELIGYLLVEGHLPGWSALLYLLGMATRDPVAMQVTHLALASGAAYLLGRFAPFSLKTRVLIASGYFVAYEYAVIARPYALGMLALFMFCAFYPRRSRHPVIIAASLALLAVSSIYGLIVAGVACGLLLLEAYLGAPDEEVPHRRRLVTGLGLAVWVIAVALATISSVAFAEGRPPGMWGASGVAPLRPWAIASTMTSITQAYLPVPDVLAPHLWGSHLVPVDTRLPLFLVAGIGGVLLILTTILLLQTPSILAFYLASTGGILLFGHLVFSGFLRHHGSLYLVFIASLWMSAGSRPRWAPPARLRGWVGSGAWWRTPVVTAILGIQVASAALLYWADLRRPFSAAPAAAQFIRDRGLEELPMAAIPAPTASSIAGLLDRPVHYFVLGSEATFIPWNRLSRSADAEVSMERMRPFIEAQEGGPMVVILGEPFDAWDYGLVVEELARFEPGLERREGFVLYLVGVGNP